MYPVTAYVAAIPFVPIPDREAAVMFVAISAFLLAYGSTADSWHRLPMFASIAFMNSVQYAQWSPLMTAMLFMPLLGVFAVAKPQTALPVLVAAGSQRLLRAAAIGAVVLIAISLLFMPSWPREWWAIIREGEQMRSPVLRLGGFLIALVLLRWRRPEAWLVFVMALMPQSWAWYNTLVLLTIARTYREAAVLSLISSAGAIVAALIIRDSSPASYSAWGAAMVAFAYLPATVAVLRRPNVSDRAPWKPRVQNAESMP